LLGESFAIRLIIGKQNRRYRAMLRIMKDLKGLAIEAKDGDIGEAND
jgi:hypothetical protein